MVHIRLLTENDLEFALALSTAAGWNQTRLDWERFRLLQPDGCWLAEDHGERLGTVVVCRFDDVAWIAMMLVREDRRGQGIGRQLMERAIDCATELGACSLRLDATPLGQPLYTRLGFTPDFLLTRYGGEIPASTPPEPQFQPTFDPEMAAALDATASGTHRRRLILQLLAEQPGQAIHTDQHLLSFCTHRVGCRAIQIGPCIAQEKVPLAGQVLLRSALAQHAGQQVMVDIPDQHQTAIEVAFQFGLTPQRPLLRMTRGPKVADHPLQIWASSGGEKG